ncbi:MAG: hypothetical protein IKW85_14100 [Muribaculaceae bacterium]|nr:hypothetical protein [Muribaculaceae bacterium]
MKQTFLYLLFVICTLAPLSSCEHEEPVNPIKPLEERTVLLVASNGEIYDQNGELVTHLPNCTFAAEIISDGDDYFVSGVQSKGRVGYWKNGKWNTLHVDFIDDVDHWTYGIGKWDYYIYLLDIPNVLKNSGIFPLEDFHDLVPANHALAVSEGKCYVIGYAFNGDLDHAHYQPVLYTNYKKEYLPMPEGALTGECHAIYAYDRDHTIIGGMIDAMPAVWVEKQYEVYPVSYPRETLGDNLYLIGRVGSVTKCNGHIYAAGFEYDYNNTMLATVWTDAVPSHYQSGWECTSSDAVEIHSYGDDVYLLTTEYNNDTDESRAHLWRNGELIKSYNNNIQVSGFTVL